MLDYQRIVARASWCRVKSGLDGTPPPYSTRLVLERAFPEIAVAGANLPSQVTEMAVKDGARRALFYNRNVHHSMQRVGLAHGLYHHLCDLRGEDGLAECNLALRRIGQVMEAAQDPIELACDLFAAELLIPFDVLDQLAPDPLWGPGALPRDAFEDECDHLASKFNVPKGFMKWRLYDLAQLRKTHFRI